MCLFGDLFEVINEGKQGDDIDWTAYYYGSVAGSVSWILIFGQVVTSPYLSDYPWYAFAYLFGYLIMFFSFPVNQYLQYK
jgi:hypothetical protein